jgi:iron-sulfur cluster repair protein YtfE (RIC family)/NACalpha-BTF3-like transcription factor
MSAEAKLEIILEALDKASSVLAEASGRITGEMNKVAEVNQRVDQAQKQTDTSARDVTVGFSGMATSAFALYLNIDRLEKAQYMVEKANLAVQRATESADQAQKSYNAAVEKYGTDSEQVKDAADKLRIANDAVALATERARIVQNDFGQAITTMALSIIPTMITAVASATKVIEGLGGNLATIGPQILSCLTNPITLAIGAIAVIGVGIYAWVSSMNAAAAEAKEFNDMLSEHYALMTSSVGTWSEMASVIDRMSGNLEKLNKKYEELIQKQAEENAGLQKVTELYGYNADQVAGLKDWYDRLYGSTQKEIDVVNQAIITEQQRMEQLQQSQKVHELFTSAMVTQSDEYQAAISELATSFTEDWAGMTELGTKDAEIQRQAIEALAAQYGVSYDEIISDLGAYIAGTEEATAKVQAEYSKLTAHLQNEFNLQQAAASQALPAIAKWFDEAFSEGRFTAAAGLVQGFADNFGISFDQAEAIIENFKEKTKEIPLTIEQELVGRAQADFENFKNCMSGKALTLNTDVTGNMAKMASNITDLIKAGLVGEAQNEMQAYVNCSTSKIADMTVQINGYMEQLTRQHNEKLATLSAMAEQAYGAERDAILAAIGAETAGYQEKMSQLVAWQRQLFSQIMADAISVQSGINAIMASAAGALSQIRGDYSAASAILQNVWEVTKSAKAVAALAKEYGSVNPPPAVTPPVVAPPELPPLLPGQPASYLPPGMESPGPTAAGVIGLPEGGTPTKEAQPVTEKIGLPTGPSVPITIQPVTRAPVIQVNAPLIQVQGSADMATVNKAVAVMTEKLKSVVIESSSSGAPSISKTLLLKNPKVG